MQVTRPHNPSPQLAQDKCLHKYMQIPSFNLLFSSVYHRKYDRNEAPALPLTASTMAITCKSTSSGSTIQNKVLKFEWPENRETAPLRICTQLPQWRVQSGDKTTRYPVLLEQLPSSDRGHQTRTRCQLGVASKTEHRVSMLRHSHIVEWIPAVECPPIENACCIKHCDPKWAAHLLHFGGGHLSNL